MCVSDHSSPVEIVDTEKMMRRVSAWILHKSVDFVLADGAVC